ncbi:M23 family metallopeptidase [Corynebacterium pseudodiphtheriticum]|uniref:M23 family metallopeptidase n=1 Tax=Corynebacterium pseudodiphtheriticum TaxID=37637 RepID=UPI002543DFCA|nr:M23 family metallopeptidase [Corynebacterium pseudodiphtheriticum]MDK4317121.1 M23 family metallopeptidase [Corynebacterium pseudodiphtheriticum]
MKSVHYLALPTVRQHDETTGWIALPRKLSSIACMLALVVFTAIPHALAVGQLSLDERSANSEAFSGVYVDPGTRTATPSPVLRGFDPPEKDWLPGHRGVDLDVAIGAPVASAGAGIVHFAGNVAGTPTVSINHAGGLRTTYQPVFPRVKAGDHVTVGEIIGTLASPTDGTPGLHWGARTGPKTYINPLDLLGEAIIRLKPWD